MGKIHLTKDLINLSHMKVGDWWRSKNKKFRYCRIPGKSNGGSSLAFLEITSGKIFYLDYIRVQITHKPTNEEQLKALPFTC